MMNFAFRFSLMTIVIFFTLMVMMINAHPIVSSEEMNYSLRLWQQKRSQAEDRIDVQGLIKRGVIQSISSEDSTAPSSYYLNKRRMYPIDYPVGARLLKRDDNNAAKIIPTASITSAAVNHTPPENNGRAAVDPSSSDAKKGDDTKKDSDATESNNVSLPAGVTTASQGFLFLPISKPSESPSKSGAANSDTSSAAHQTFFFNIASPDGGSVSKFEVKGGGGDDDGNKSNGKASSNNDATKSTPTTDAASNPPPPQSDKTRIIFKPLNDPESNNQSKSAPSSTEVKKPSSTNDDIQNNNKNNSGTSAKGASDPHADDKSPNDKNTNDEKAPTTSQSTVGANEKKDDSNNSSPPPKEKKNDDGNNKGDDSGKGKGNQGNNGGGDNSSKPSEGKKSGENNDSGPKPQPQGQNGSGNGNKQGGDDGSKTDNNSSKKTNNDASTPNTKPNGSGKEDDYYLFPVEQDNKTVELNKGDMVAYVDHPQLAASKMNPNPPKPSKRAMSPSTFTKREYKTGMIHPNMLKRRGEIIHTITLTRRYSPTKLISRRNQLYHNDKKSSLFIRSLSLAFTPIKHLLTRDTLQPGKVGVTPAYWNGEPIKSTSGLG